MKAFSRFATENVSVYLCVVLMALLSACGDDSKTSSHVPEEDLAVDESSSSNAQKGFSSSLETIVDV